MFVAYRELSGNFCVSNLINFICFLDYLVPVLLQYQHSCLHSYTHDPSHRGGA